MTRPWKIESQTLNGDALSSIVLLSVVHDMGSTTITFKIIGSNDPLVTGREVLDPIGVRIGNAPVRVRGTLGDRWQKDGIREFLIWTDPVSTESRALELQVGATILYATLS